MFVRMARFTSRAYSDGAWRTTSGHYDPTAWLALGLQDFSEPMTGVSRGSLLLQGTGARRVKPRGLLEEELNLRSRWGASTFPDWAEKPSPCS